MTGFSCLVAMLVAPSFSMMFMFWILEKEKVLIFLFCFFLQS